MSATIIFKIVLLGDGAVGKTSIRSKYMGEGFKSDYLLTIGVDFATKDLSVDVEGKKRNFKCQIWDLAGQDRFNFLRNQFLKGTQGVLFIYDSTRPETLESAIDWFYELEKEIKKPVPILILGNKIDAVPEDQRDILPKEVKLSIWEKEKKFPILGTSALTGENVDIAFETIINEILSKK